MATFIRVNIGRAEITYVNIDHVVGLASLRGKYFITVAEVNESIPISGKEHDRLLEVLKSEERVLDGEEG
jgi:hypothetical protein